MDRGMIASLISGALYEYPTPEQSKLCDHIAGLIENAERSRLSESRAVAEGEWKFVPVKPTEAMIEAGCSNNPTMWNDDTPDNFAADVANDVYVSMLRAAPVSPAPQADMREAQEKIAKIIRDELDETVDEADGYPEGDNARDVAVKILAALSSVEAGAGEPEAEFWCRLFGQAMDALDECSGDDEEGWNRQEHAQRATEELRKQYVNRPVPALSQSPTALGLVAAAEWHEEQAKRTMIPQKIMVHQSAAKHFRSLASDRREEGSR